MKEFPKIGKLQTAADVLYELRFNLIGEISNLEKGIGCRNETLTKVYNQLGDIRNLIAGIALVTEDPQWKIVMAS